LLGGRGRTCLRHVVAVHLRLVLWQLPRREAERERLIRLALLQPDQTPSLVQHAATLARRDPQEYFEYGLETILTGLEARLHAHRAAHEVSTQSRQDARSAT